MRMLGEILSCLAIVGLSVYPAHAADKGIITGRVIWQDGGEGIAEVKIYAQNRNGSASIATYTDALGYFNVQVPAGAYVVSAEKQNCVTEYYPDEYSSKEADLIAVSGGEVRHLLVSLDLGGWISGNFSFYGDDIDYGLLTAIKVDEPYAGWFKSQSLSGSFPSAYAVTGLIPGSYKILGRARGKSTEYYPGVLRPEDATTIPVQRGLGVNDISFLLDQVGWGMIQGRVYDLASGVGVCGAKALVYQWLNYHEDPALDSVSTGSDGRFLFNLPAGNYYVTVFYSEHFGSDHPIAMYYYNHYHQALAEQVELAAGQQLTEINFPIDFSIPHDLTISGNISNELSGTGLDGVLVTAIDYETGEIMGTGNSCNDGEFYISCLSPRRYLLMFTGTEIIPYFFSRAYSWQDADVITLDRDFGGVRTEAITQDYGDNGLAILGRVTGNGRPLEGARIYAIPIGRTDPLAFATSDAYGEYSIIGGLASARYTVICDLYGYDKDIYPFPIEIDLLENPIADDINFELMPLLSQTADQPPLGMSVKLAGNYPNPFNAQTIINFYSPRIEAFDGVISAYNLLGQIVGRKTLRIAPGINRVIWDLSDFGRPVSSGVYYYRIEGVDAVGRMILLK